MRTTKLNDVDRTSYFTQLQVQYKKILGDNGGTFLSGDREEDVLAYKAVVTLVCLPLTDAQQADIFQAISVADPTLYYFDPMTNGYKTIHCMMNVAQVTNRGKGGTGTEYWTGLVITAEEK